MSKSWGRRLGNTPLQTEGKLELRCAGTVWYVQDTAASSELMGHKVAGDEARGVTGEVKEGMDHLGGTVILKQNGHPLMSYLLRREGARVFILQPPFKVV